MRFYGHQKHSCYMILNSNIYGATHREIVMAAFVATADKREEMSSEWAKYKDVVAEEGVDAVRKLAMLLRIAQSLDRSGMGMITGINCDLLGDSVIMKTEVAGDASLEIRNAMRTNTEFRKVFKKNLEIL